MGIDGESSDRSGGNLDSIIIGSTLNQDSEPLQQPRGVISEVGAYAVSVPKLLYRLARSPDVPVSSKLQVLATIAYLVCPADLIPDFIPGLGWLDDFVVAAGVIANAVDRIGKETVLKYWDGPRESFDRICSLAGITYDLVRRIKPYSGKMGKRFYNASKLLMK